MSNESRPIWRRIWATCRRVLGNLPIFRKVRQGRDSIAAEYDTGRILGPPESRCTDESPIQLKTFLGETPSQDRRVRVRSGGSQRRESRVADLFADDNVWI